MAVGVYVALICSCAIFANARVSPFAHPVSFKSLLLELNMTMDELFSVEANDFVYSYSQASARFSGPAFDGGQINVVGCSGLNGVDRCGDGNCRNNPRANCCKDCGPCSRGQYRLSQEIVYHNMPHCYALSIVSGGCSNRDGFLIHGGDGTTCASGNPSDGCIVIESDQTRYLIKGGGLLNVVS